MSEDETIIEITSKLSGVILAKAELHGNYKDVYNMVLERMYKMMELNTDEFLTVLGNIGS